MHCIICFIDDDFQARLREQSQLRHDRFEKVIYEYKELFQSQIKTLCMVKDCNTHKSTPQALKNIMDTTILDIFKKDALIEQCFNDLILTYKEWIKGNIEESINLLRLYLTRCRSSRLDLGHDTFVYMRGRVSSSPLAKEENFHIPFSKRYLISNQRYSVTGQPLLYLGASALDVLYELRLNVSDISKVQMSPYTLKDIESLKIFENVNLFYKLYKSIELSVEQSGDSFDLSNFTTENYRQMINGLILAFMCSFRRGLRGEELNGRFSEEYVIPQLLTYVLKTHENKYHGISFNSTRMTSKVAFSKSKLHESEYKNNLALFTDYNDSYDYDFNLLNKFDITPPVSFNHVSNIDDYEITGIMSELISLFAAGKRASGYNLKSMQLSGLRFKNNYQNVYLVEGKKDKKYLEHDVGKFHEFLIYQALAEIRKKMLL